MKSVDKPSEDKLMSIVATVQIPAEATDCQKLASLITGLQKAYFELCDTCKPVETVVETGPAVCDLGDYVPKVIE